ncbi:type IV pilin protein [Geopsychrobacter electrodiphilus]|uniref:type IV pilin protein n=1 Tax=Geopsychrobacter electrodiphilus TaxID=225196 RepID=UPI00036DFBA0|nr:type IV pilin protein [Geopsychrobacter electrodiphilus]
MFGNEKGFTLIELMIVIGILGILAAIAIPVYSGYRHNAYRAAAKAALVEGAQNMERYFTRKNEYKDAKVGDPATGDQVLQTTEGGKYTLTFQPGSVTTAATTTTFTIRATPSFTDKCGYLEITQTGAKTSEIAANCW